MQEKKDWLNNFIEKNAWGLLVALIGVIITYTVLRGQVQANVEDIKTIEENQVIITKNQQDIITLQIVQENVVEDVDEIKKDVKELLRRP